MRTSNTFRNAITSILLSVVTILAGFIGQRLLAVKLNAGYLGINGLFTNMISMLSVIELGVGSAIVYHLYKPLSTKDTAKIQSILLFYKKCYRFVALAIAAIGLAIVPFLSIIVKNHAGVHQSIALIFLLFVADTAFSYLLTYKRSILYADQKNYLINIGHVFYVIAMTTGQVIVLLTTRNFYAYLIIKIIARLIENICLLVITNRHYNYLTARKAQKLDHEIKKDIYKKVRGLMLHKIGSFVVLGSDNIVISTFIGIREVGLYANYYLVISACIFISSQIIGAATASIGNLLVSNSTDKAYGVYKKLRFINYALAILIVSGFLATISSIVTLWLGKAYVLPFGVVLALAVNMYLQIMRSTTISYKEAAGIFHEDRFMPLLESAVNIVLSITFLKLIGLAGVFWGTVCSNLVLHLYSYPKYVYTKLFNKTYASYYRYFVRSNAMAALIFTTVYLTSSKLVFHNILATIILQATSSLAISCLVLLAAHRNDESLHFFLALIKKIVHKIKLSL